MTLSHESSAAAKAEGSVPVGAAERITTLDALRERPIRLAELLD